MTLDDYVYVSGQSIKVGVAIYDADEAKSSISKIGYVEVINSDNHSVLQRTILLDGATGYCELFIPSTWPTGNYGVIAYTNWMRNFSTSEMPVKTVSIFNPFKSNPGKVQNNDRVLMQPLGAAVISGTENTFLFGLADKYNRLQSFSGRVLNPQGEVIRNFETKNNGIASVKWLVEKEVTYKLILTKPSGEIIYHTLSANKWSDGIGVEIWEEGSSYKILCKDQSVKERRNWLIYLNANTSLPIESFSSTDNWEEFEIAKSKLREGHNTFRLMSGDETLFLGRLQGNTLKPKVRISLPDSVFQARQKVSPKITFREDIEVKDLSISVTRFDQLSEYRNLPFREAGDLQVFAIGQNHELSLQEMSELLWIEDSVHHDFTKKPTCEHVPELLGKLVSGTISDQQESGLSNVVLSIPQQKGKTWIAEPDDKGNFYFDMGTGDFDQAVIDYSATSASTISLHDYFIPQHDFVQINPLWFQDEIAEDLTIRSTASQLQNAYFPVRQKESIATEIEKGDQGEVETKTFKLDDFTRFSKMEDVFREVLTTVSLRKRKGNYSVRFFYLENGNVISQDALVMLDGLFIDDIEELLEINPLKIESIDLVPLRYGIGNRVGDGLVRLNSYNQDPLPLIKRDGRREISSFRLEQTLEEAIKHDENMDLRMPDFRTQLYWKPWSTFEQQPTFYTSDVSGKYVIRIRGIDENGEELMGQAYFNVKNQKVNQ